MRRGPGGRSADFTPIAANSFGFALAQAATTPPSPCVREHDLGLCGNATTPNITESEPRTDEECISARICNERPFSQGVPGGHAKRHTGQAAGQSASREPGSADSGRGQQAQDGDAERASGPTSTRGLCQTSRRHGGAGARESAAGTATRESARNPDAKALRDTQGNRRTRGALDRSGNPTR